MTARWYQFAQQYQLDKGQRERFERYALLLMAWNKRINLTAIRNESDILDFHFKDSLQLSKIIALQKIEQIVDVGTGAGLPGIPLAIKYPHIQVTLIEVNAKKIKFLDNVIQELKLEGQVDIFDQDWRTFLRKTELPAQCFCARASLQPDELVRIFKPASYYKGASLVYWASAQWEPSKTVAPFIIDQKLYQIGSKQRKLVLLQNNQ